jgi:hypothetical protein
MKLHREVVAALGLVPVRVVDVHAAQAHRGTVVQRPLALGARPPGRGLPTAVIS